MKKTGQTNIKSWWRHQMETFSALLAFGRGIHRLSVIFPHKSQWRGAMMYSLSCAWTIGWVNNRDAGDLRRHRAHYDVIVMCSSLSISSVLQTRHLLRALALGVCLFQFVLYASLIWMYSKTIWYDTRNAAKALFWHIKSNYIFYNFQSIWLFSLVDLVI